ncbi:MAG TPA: hypothetical protein VEP90_07610 [Methylomirabilota bacterium]|nr:hypothetical protein [Methylomirabilota bacterium]
MTERKRRGQNKPHRQATRDYRNHKKDGKSNKSIDRKNNTEKVVGDEKQEASSLKLEQPTAITATLRNEFIPEGSSGSYATSEMKDSTSIYEDDLQKAISTVQKNEPIKAEDTSLQPTSINTYLHSVNPTTIMQERRSVVAGSREGSSHAESRRLNNDNPFMSGMALWQNSMNNCIGIYKVYSENVAKMMREYWIKPFWISHK